MRLHNHAQKMKALAHLGFGAMVLMAVEAQAAEWNLPYARPKAYDYSAYYDATLTTYLTAAPDYFPAELTKAWTYYKSTFMIQSGNGAGLVNHRRMENGTEVGTNEAVSEGQGYGMLLAVLNNDQPTFNKIFEAANQYIWDGGHKSYYHWSWPGKGDGAATDADLDIALALVFADELEKKSFWTKYSGSVSYGSRALELIKSIKQNMTASNYLLPGDSWGGDGVNNLNPSYFATAWLKVFNLYQKDVDFTPVIDNCYNVLAKTPRYGTGIVPDWCNQNGGQSSQGGGKQFSGMGMLSDAIRTPYRIAMDALWFNDSRAIAYCKNAMKTLTQYNATTAQVLAAQMGQFDNTGKIITETSGSFSEVAMWSTAMVGTKDATYKTGMKSVLVGIITGNSSGAYFGSSSLQDHKFYYKQSLAMLGFAVIGGQFPNILSDEKVKVSPIFSARPKALKTQQGQNLPILSWSPEAKKLCIGPSGSNFRWDIQGRNLEIPKNSGFSTAQLP